MCAHRARSRRARAAAASHHHAQRNLLTEFREASRGVHDSGGAFELSASALTRPGTSVGARCGAQSGLAESCCDQITLRSRKGQWRRRRRTATTSAPLEMRWLSYGGSSSSLWLLTSCGAGHARAVGRAAAGAVAGAAALLLELLFDSRAVRCCSRSCYSRCCDAAARAVLLVALLVALLLAPRSLGMRTAGDLLAV